MVKIKNPTVRGYLFDDLFDNRIDLENTEFLMGSY